MKEQKYCNQKIELASEEGYEIAVLKCREINGHKLPHKTKISKTQCIYWSEGTC